ncbi:SGNH hydrolase-type esterase domain-containing protein [Podospora appendiculata]|uniref:SGNH hydrolase-type esterase domain-containing protein n=1 Tax=Podospora appendiculata TaxID=314037 RepID=A0AAE1CBP6_9PEZI|nr:SGNH hydrolase-type esterase domain-containing protein [Podospora appendiculata]
MMATHHLLRLLGILAAVSIGATQSTTVRIMPLGDSITGSPGCWRALLWRKLQAAKITNTKFVGTLPAQGCGFTYDGANEGHGGYLATGIVAKKQLSDWLAQTHPDVVMMHLGTNDVWNNQSPEAILAAFGTLVDWMRASKADVKILVAQIIPMSPPNCAQCAARVVALNAAIPAWAAGKNTTLSPLVVVDCWTGFDAVKDTRDGVHPNDSGNLKLADAWFGPLVRAIQG